MPVTTAVQERIRNERIRVQDQPKSKKKKEVNKIL
jgi:hypothetical protein